MDAYAEETIRLLRRAIQAVSRAVDNNSSDDMSYFDQLVYRAIEASHKIVFTIEVED